MKKVHPPQQHPSLASKNGYDGYLSIDRNLSQESDDNQIKDLLSFLIIGFIVFIGDTGRGLMFPTLWPLVFKLGGNEMTQGFTVAAFSFGRVLASPYFGKMSGLIGYKKVLIFASCVMICGCLLYAMAMNCYFLILGQIFIGIGSGTLGVTRAYVADNSSKKTRTILMAKITALQYAGFTVTPCLGGLLAWMLSSNVYFLPMGITLSQYTAPAFFMILLCLVGIVLLKFGFKDYIPGQTLQPDRRRPPLPQFNRPEIRNSITASLMAMGVSSTVPPSFRSSPRTGSLTPSETSASSSPVPMMMSHSEPNSPPSHMATANNQAREHTEVSDKLWRSMVGWGLVMNVVTKGSVACCETLGTIVAIGTFGLTKSHAGYLFSSCGFAGVLALLMMQHLVRWFDDIKLVFYGCVLMVCAALILFLGVNAGLTGLYVAIFLMYSVGYPIGHTAVIGIFSKIVGARTDKQGGLLGWFGSAGSLARIIFPIACGFVSSQYGSNVMFMYVGIMVSISIGALLCLWKYINRLIS